MNLRRRNIRLWGRLQRRRHQEAGVPNGSSARALSSLGVATTVSVGRRCRQLGWPNHAGRRSRRGPRPTRQMRLSVGLRTGCARSRSDNWLPGLRGARLTPRVTGVLHDDEIPIDTGLVRALVDRAMPRYVGLPVRRLDSSGSTNALFRFGEDLLVRLPRQPGGSATIAKEAKWLPVLGPSLPVGVPEVVAVFEPDCDYPERWAVVRWIDGEHPEVVTPETLVDPRRGDLAADLAEVVSALGLAEVPSEAAGDPYLLVPRRATRDHGRGDPAEHRALPGTG
jgi:hypothetical protein